MNKTHFLLLNIFAAIGLIFSFCPAAERVSDNFAQVELVLQHDAVAPDSNSAIEIKFNLDQSWHFYADEKTAPPGMHLAIKPQAKGLNFAQPVFPKGRLYFDKITNRKLEVLSGNFNIFIPFTTDIDSRDTEIKVAIEGAACSDQLCAQLNYELSKKLEISQSAETNEPKFSIPAPAITEKAASQIPQTSTAVALSLAILAGLLLNVMPCVWPVLPIIVIRLISHSEKSRAKRYIAGLAFAVGIVLFFIVLAAFSIILKLGFGLVFQWGDQFRNTSFVIVMALLMVVLALYMFGIVTFGLPASIAGGKSYRDGFIGSLGMGFLAAVLSTPCSFGILAFVLAWSQTQPIPLAAVTIILIGVGMALPFIILTAIPKLLQFIPKPGKWMELFKQAAGFILLAIGVKLLEAVQVEKIINVLYYALVLAVCIWMSGVWVTYNTPRPKKYFVRLLALALAIIFGFILLAEPKKGLITWQPYDPQVIADAQQAQRPVLIKFTADWCLSCKVLDKTVYSGKEIADLISRKNVLAIKADTTHFNSPAVVALKEIYKEPAIPVTVLLLPGQNTPVKLRGNLIKSELIKNLQSLKDAAK